MKKILLFLAIVIAFISCDMPTKPDEPVSNSGVKKATITVQTDINGETIEQENIKARLKMDNQPGSIKHLYVISAYSGQVLIYSTVKGKVTSSGKRLNPYSVSVTSGEYNYNEGIPVLIDGKQYTTGEVLQDDGTYGSSSEYVYWWDTNGNYHQQYMSSGIILHISDQPLVVKGIIINMSEVK